MPGFPKNSNNLDLKLGVQLLAATLFIFIGFYILITTFENNYILIGLKKYLFGGILVLYGLVRIARVYFELNKRKKTDEKTDY